MTAVLLLSLVLPWLLVAFACWLGIRMVGQFGRIVVRLEEIEDRLSAQGPVRAIDPANRLPMAQPPVAQAPARGLPVGTEAPDFSLPDLAGNTLSLADFRGRRLLLVSWDPGCGFCRQMAPRLADLPTDGRDGRPLPVLIASGDPEQNRTLARDVGIHCPILLQEGVQVTSQYQATGTPMGYLVDEQGHTASDLAIGAEALLALAGPSTPQEQAPHAANGHAPYKRIRSLDESRLIRTGLAAGTQAPDFRLPRIDDGEITLDAFRGQPVLLVFSDPHCGPCTEVALRLEEVHRASRGLQILVVSRGDRDENRAKASELNLTFPIALQRGWEVSRAYGMFATPIAYLIDERGTIVADVATGRDAILDLAQRGSGGASGEVKEVRALSV